MQRTDSQASEPARCYSLINGLWSPKARSACAHEIMSLPHELAKGERGLTAFLYSSSHVCATQETAIQYASLVGVAKG